MLSSLSQRHVFTISQVFLNPIKLILKTSNQKASLCQSDTQPFSWPVTLHCQSFQTPPTNHFKGARTTWSDSDITTAPPCTSVLVWWRPWSQYLPETTSIRLNVVWSTAAEVSAHSEEEAATEYNSLHYRKWGAEPSVEEGTKDKI